MIKRTVLSIALCALMICSTSSAQRNYGFGTPGAAGNIPTIDSNQAWLGRPDFGISVSNSAAFTQVFYLIAGAPAAGSFIGIPLWVDTNGLFEVSPGMVPSGFTDASGEATLNLPLPNIPLLTGFQIYAQALCFDIDPNTGLPSSTDGVEITFTAPPQVAVGTSVGGSSDPFYLVNPQGLFLDWSGGNNFTNNTYGNMTYTDAGRYLYVASSITASLNRLDLNSPTPVFTTIDTFPTTNGTNDGCWGTSEDVENDILWTLATDSIGNRELIGIDIDLTSPNYGSRIGQTSTIPQSGFPEVWTLSNDGKTAIVGAALSNLLHFVDTDPASPTFLQVLQSIPAPGTGFFNSAIGFSPDDDIVYVTRVPLGGDTSLARYDVDAGAWIDHDPQTPQIDNLGPNSNPTVFLGGVVPGMSVAPQGDIIYLSSSNTGQVTKLEFSGAGWIETIATGASLPQVWGLDVNPDGTFLAGPSWNPPQLNFWDADTMQFLYSVSLPGGSNIYNVNWR